MSPFEQLGLTSTASKEEVTTAWRKLAMVHHPDRGGKHEEFVKLKLAYEAALKQVGPAAGLNEDIFGNKWSSYQQQQGRTARANQNEAFDKAWRDRNAAQNARTAQEQASHDYWKKMNEELCTACSGLGKIRINSKSFGQVWVLCPVCSINQRKKK